jgi:hypothetical protein
VFVVGEGRERQKQVPIRLGSVAEPRSGRPFGSAEKRFAQDDAAKMGFAVSHPSLEKMRRMGHPLLVVGEGRSLWLLKGANGRNWSCSTRLGWRASLRAGFRLRLPATAPGLQWLWAQYSD